MRTWRNFIPEEEMSIYKNAGFAKAYELGQRPALLVVDCTYAFIGNRPGQTIEEAMADYPTACGPAGWESLPKIKTLLEACRAASMPIIFTLEDVEASTVTGLKATKGGSNRPPQSPEVIARGNEIPDIIRPLESEWVLGKAKASAFHATMLTTYLTMHSIDTLIVTGTTTSGCINATVVDGFAQGYNVFVVEDCCFDRSHTSHIGNLWDMAAKYATVVTGEEIIPKIAKNA